LKPAVLHETYSKRSWKNCCNVCVTCLNF